MSSLWVKSRNGNDQAFMIDFEEGMNFAQLKKKITLERQILNLPVAVVQFIHSEDRDEKEYILRAGAKVPNPDEGQIGSSEDLPYFFSIAQTQAVPAPAIPVPVDQQEEDPIINGIYERLAENDSEPLVNNFITFGPLSLLVRQEWIDLKHTILTERADKHHKTIFLSGTSGRGKSSFVYYLMYCILIAAKGSKKRKAEQDLGEQQPLVGYVRSIPSKLIVHFLLTLNGVKSVAIIPISVCYYIADTKEDVNQTNLAQRFTMAVASDDAGKFEFLKRIDEADKNHGSGYTYAMTSPTREEMHLIFGNDGQMNTEEIDFRLDVVGCNPRAFAVKYRHYKRYPEYETLIEESCSDVLKCGPETDTVHFNWVKYLIMKSINKAMASDQSKVNMSSLFREDVIEGEHLISVYTSTFMCFLAGKIRDKFAAETTTILTQLFGRSGVGNCHEYDAHNFFCGLTSATHPCWRLKDRKWVTLPLGGGHRQKVVFRNINSISTALGNSAGVVLRYLLPSISNLALIDSIIPAIPPAVTPDVLQMTVSDKHRGATNRTAEIRYELGNPATMRMIFVVPESVIAKFNFPTDMPEYVEMYVTVAKAVTLQEAKKLRS